MRISSASGRIIDVYQGGQGSTRMTPQRLIYKASQQASTKPDIVHASKKISISSTKARTTKASPSSRPT